MKHPKILAALAALTLGAAAASAETLTIATEGAYPPFNNTTADGELVGFDVDIANALCEAMQRECEIVAQDWDGIIPGLVQEKYDAIVASMSITEERLQSIDFTNPYYSNYLALVAKDGGSMSMDDVDGKAIGAQRSTIASEWAEDTYGRRGDVKLYDTQTAAYSDLTAGRIDVLVSDHLPVAEWLKENPDYALIGDKIDIDDKIGIGIRQGEDELKDAFNAALEQIRSDGTYKVINDQYFPVDIF
ncbi:MAG: transporter substrate-binding domain-containing protein [Alphaproteobacteria bacterium]|nr:transporter substrate-binding domain-containing protein [Alphaproteobacteria bacterium]